MDNNELWGGVLREIELAVSKANFVTWFNNTSIVDRSAYSVTIATPNPFVKEWLEYKYHKHIMKSLRGLDPDVRTVEYVISSASVMGAKTALAKPPAAPPAETEEQLGFTEFAVDPQTNLNSRYTLNNLIVGSFNELAYAAALAVVKNVGTLYNPLFIYGGVGLGKTHLLHAVGNEIKQQRPTTRIKYVSSELFTSELVSSIQNNETEGFKERYRQNDVLLIDDIQFISGKVKTQEEFFHTFNALHGANKQVVFSSDGPPKSIQHLEDRLRSRFEGGMIVDINEPEYESRLAILKTKLAEKKQQLNQEILEQIAAYVESNVRELEGALNAVVAHQAHSPQRALNQNEVREILAKNSAPKRSLTATQIIKTVAEFYDVNEKVLFEKTRRKDIVKPRQICMFLLREDFNGSYPYIGQKFGGRDHTTALHAYEKILNNLKNSEQLAGEIKQIRNILYKRH